MESLYLLNVFDDIIELNGLDFDYMKNTNKQIDNILLQKLKKINGLKTTLKQLQILK